MKLKVLTHSVLALLLVSFSVISCTGCSGKERELPENPVKFQRYTQDMTFHSDILREDVRYSVLLPAGYTQDKDKRYPVVYMLHGLGDNNNSWNGNYLHANEKIEALEAKGLSDMIYVFPFGHNSYYCNQYDGKYKYMDMFVQELIPQIDASLRTIADREHRCITGYSMGGFGAMALAEIHPEMFLCSAPLSMSFRTDEQYMAESQSGWNGQWGFIFGGVNVAGYGRITDYYKAHCPFYQFTAENAAKLSQVHWFFTCGDDEEQLLIANDSLHAQLSKIGFPHEFRVDDGAHTSKYWMNALNEVLPMFDYYMKGGQNWEGINMTVPTVREVAFAEDGTLCSDAFTQAGAGTGVYIVYDGADEAIAKKVMSYIHKPSSSFAYIYLPCNLSEKTFTEWVNYYAGKYDITKKQALSFGNGAKQLWENRSGIVKFYLVDALLGDGIVADPEVQYIFAAPDDGAHSYDMGQLYKSCKLGEAKYEYRVINGTGNFESDVLRSIETIKSHIIY